MTKPRVSLIVAALLPEFGIGYKGQLPWSLKKEMKYFRQLTTSTLNNGKKNAVIMGRKTYNSIPEKFRPLKGRLNVVLTRNLDHLATEMKDELERHKDNLELSDSLPNTILDLTLKGEIEEIFIIGGAEVYNNIMQEHANLIDDIYLTEVRHSNGDKVEMDAYFQLQTAKWGKCPDTELKSILSSKSLTDFSVLTDNEEDCFIYDFTLYRKK